MVRTARLILALAFLGGILPMPKAFGQAQTPEPLKVPPAVVGATKEPDPLPGLPRPLEQPRSLMQPASAMPLSCPLPGPYFEYDPLVDLPLLSPPGCFAAVEIDPAFAHVKNGLSNGTVPNNTLEIVRLPSAELSWTVAPRFELGYRLPSGFGEFVIGYRFLATEGTGSLAGSDGVAVLKSRLDIDTLDFDYASREISLWPNCDMKWRFGGRVSYVFFDSRADEPFAAAAAASGTGIFERRNSNRYVGFGPHVGLQLARRFGDSGLALVGGIDFSINLGRIRQGFVEVGTTAGGGGETHVSSSQAVPVLNTQIGLSWKPPAWQNLSFFLGYQYEYWWSIGRLSLTTSPETSRGELSDQGIVLRADINF